MPKSIEIPADLESGGKIEMRVSEGTSEGESMLHIIYHPEDEPSKPLFFGSRDVTGMGRMIALSRHDDGTWQANIQMKSNESREFSIHIGSPEGPPDFSSPEHFQSKICLMHGDLVNQVYENPKLPEEKKGRLEKRIYRADGGLSEPLPEDYEKKDGEELVDIYIPAGYSPEQKYPIQVFLDGEMHVRKDSFGNSIGTPHILDNLIASGEMAPVITVFTSPSPVAADGSNQRLREYACNPETDARLAHLPQAIANAGLSAEANGATICGQSLGGLQAIYTAKMHPDVFSTVIAQSPAVWWEPPDELSGERAVYEIDATWRHSLRDPFPLELPMLDEALQKEMVSIPYRGYVHEVLDTGVDRLTGKKVPEGEVKIFLQAGTHETGTISRDAGYEPLTQATITLAEQLSTSAFIYDGAHTPQPWATGITTILPSIYPNIEPQMVNQSVAGSAPIADGRSTEARLEKQDAGTSMLVTPTSVELLAARDRMGQWKGAMDSVRKPMKEEEAKDQSLDSDLSSAPSKSSHY